MNPNKTILIVDDEPRTREGIKKMLQTWGEGSLTLLTADNGLEALERMRNESIDLLITDIRMPEISGLNLVDQLEKGTISPKPAVILISAFAEFDYAHQAIEYGVVNYLLKPISKEKLLSTVKLALEVGEERGKIKRMQKIVDPKLMDGVSGDSKVLSDPVKDVIAYVDEHLHLTISLREVAGHIHLNPSYLSALFKEQMQITFSEYVTRRKLQRARELLLQTKLPIAEIAESVGFQTPKYFNKLFKEYEGTTPGNYRQSMAGENSDIQ